MQGLLCDQKKKIDFFASIFFNFLDVELYKISFWAVDFFVFEIELLFFVHTILTVTSTRSSVLFRIGKSSCCLYVSVTWCMHNLDNFGHKFAWEYLFCVYADWKTVKTNFIAMIMFNVNYTVHIPNIFLLLQHVQNFWWVFHFIFSGSDFKKSTLSNWIMATTTWNHPISTNVWAKVVILWYSEALLI